jgi:uncharacterized protein YjbI with pentapeptide repeats
MLLWSRRGAAVGSRQAPREQVVRVQVESVPPVSKGQRDWWALAVGALPALVAASALVFTGLSLRATDRQLAQNGEQVTADAEAQITDRFNAAITNLSSSNVVIQLGGIYGLQRIMVDSPSEQPDVLSVLCAYVRSKSPGTGAFSPNVRIAPEVQAALTVIVTRNPAHDYGAEIDLSETDLSGADLAGAQLDNADMENSNLTFADLDGAHLIGTDFADSRLVYASLDNSTSIGIKFVGTNLTQANLSGADLRLADFDEPTLLDTYLVGARLSGIIFSNVNLDGFAGVSIPTLRHDEKALAADIPQSDLTVLDRRPVHR